jgi:hypothetical protein
MYVDAANIKSYPGSGTTWFDMSGRGNNGTLTNGPTYSSSNAGSIAFDGVDDYVVVGSLGTLPIQGTIEYWMRPTVLENYRNPVSTHHTSGNVGFRWEQQGSGLFYVVIGNDAASYNVYNYPNLSANQWYYVVVTWDTTASTATGYLNGAQAFTTASNTTWPTNISNFALGVGLDTVTADRKFKGNISKAAVYSKALSATEVLQNFNATRGRFGI